MKEYAQFAWKNSKRTLYALLKWFLFALIARLAFVAVLAAVIGVPSLGYLALDTVGAPVVVSSLVWVLALIGTIIGFGVVLDSIDPVMKLERL